MANWCATKEKPVQATVVDSQPTHLRPINMYEEWSRDVFRELSRLLAEIYPVHLLQSIGTLKDEITNGWLHTIVVDTRVHNNNTGTETWEFLINNNVDHADPDFVSVTIRRSDGCVRRFKIVRVQVSAIRTEFRFVPEGMKHDWFFRQPIRAQRILINWYYTS
jgi:hypothetical protein